MWATTFPEALKASRGQELLLQSPQSIQCALQADFPVSRTSVTKNLDEKLLAPRKRSDRPLSRRQPAETFHRCVEENLRN